jgi:hypothetical protein
LVVLLTPQVSAPCFTPFSSANGGPCSLRSRSMTWQIEFVLRRLDDARVYRSGSEAI